MSSHRRAISGWIQDRSRFSAIRVRCGSFVLLFSRRSARQSVGMNNTTTTHALFATPVTAWQTADPRQIYVTRKPAARAGTPDLIPVAQPMRDLLHRWARRGVAALSAEEFDQVCDYLVALSVAQSWLLCVCLAKSEVPIFALLNPQVRRDPVDRNRIINCTLRRHTTCFAHSRACPFFSLDDSRFHRLVVQLPASDKRRPAPAVNRIELRNIPIVAPEQDAQLSELGSHRPDRSDATTHCSLPADMRLLTSALAAAGLNILRIARTRAEQGALLREAFLKVKIDGQDGITLADLVSIDPPSPTESLADRTIALRLRWRGDTEPMIYEFLLAERVDHQLDGTTILELAGESAGQTLSLPFLLSKLARTTDEARAPYIVVLRAWAEKGGTPVRRTGFAHPILSLDEWVPVDAHSERKTARALCRTIAKLPDRLHAVVQIEKELSTSKNKDGEHVLADFGVRIGNRVIAWVESMGRNDKPYLELKELSHASMEKLAPVYKVDRVGMKDADADALLHVQVCDLLRAHGYLAPGEGLDPQEQAQIQPASNAKSEQASLSRSLVRAVAARIGALLGRTWTYLRS